MDNFRVFGPDETQSNQLEAIYEVGKKVWLGEYFPEDADGGELAPDGRVMEMLSEHTLEGWLEGYILSGRHGLINSYEPFVHVIDSMFNQHAKWLEKCNELPWRAKVSSLNLLITAPGLAAGPQRLHAPGPRLPRRGRQQEPQRGAHLPAARRQLPAVGRRPLPAQRQLRQRHRRGQAGRTCSTWTWTRRSRTAPRALGIWNWASNDQGVEPDVVMASCGDMPTMESLAATALLRQHLPDLKVRFVNVVDLFRLVPQHRAPARADRPRVRGPLHCGQAGRLQLPRLPLADPPAHLPPARPAQHPRARLQGAGQHQHAAGAGHPQPDRPLQPGDGRHRPDAPLPRHRRARVREALLNQQIACKQSRLRVRHRSARRSRTGSGHY